MSTRFNIAPPPHVKVRWVEGKVMGSRAIQWLTFRMHKNFIWGVVPMSYPCCIRIVTVSYLPYHVSFSKIAHVVVLYPYPCPCSLGPN